MPTYYTPPPTPPPALPSPAPLPSRPDSWSRSDDVYSQSHSSKSSSSSKSKGHSSSHRDSHGKHDDEGHSHKIPYTFLGSIAAATYLAHKYWPKGFLYGDKEDWELSSHERRARERMREEQEAKHREKHRFGSSPDHPPPPPRRDREQRRAGYRSSAAAGIGAGVGAGSYCSREEEETESEIYRGRDPRDRGRRLPPPPPPPARSLSRDGEFDRYSEIDDLRGGTRNGNIHRRTPSRERSITGNGSDIVPSERPSRRERDSYYPPAPQRYVIERSSMVTGLRHSDPDGGRPASRYLLESRASAASDPIFHRTETVRQRPRYYEDDLPARASEVVHVYRDPPPPSRARRASMDAGSGRRYDGDYDWRYR